MDPNANLAEQEQLITAKNRSRLGRAQDRERLRELREALGEWLSRGGFQPDWTRAPLAARWYGRA